MFHASLNLILIIFSLILPISEGVAAYNIPKIKVKIAGKMKSVLISGTDLLRVNHIGKDSKVYAGKKSVKYNCDFYSKKRVKRAIKNKPLLLASINSKTGLISLNTDQTKRQKKYNGRLHLITSPSGDTCDIVNELSIEKYISTLLSKEMNGNWPVEALKAQAIAARTYALFKMKNKQVSKVLGFNAHYDLESSEKHQVSGEFFDITNNTLKATMRTKGEVLYASNGRMTPIFFHANCGGRTLLPNLVWENHVAGYKSVKCPFCKLDTKRKWQKKINLKRFSKFLSWAQDKSYIKPVVSAKNKTVFRFVPDHPMKTKLRFYIDDELIVLKKTLLRRYFGRVLFPSNYFNISFDSKKQVFPVRGKGLGHGVGMCQLGALDFAKKGWGYKKILSHYFPGHQLKKIY